MMKVLKRQNAATYILLLVGIGLVGASLLADVIGIGDDAGFGSQQTMGTIAEAVLAAVALFLNSGQRDGLETRTDDA